MFLKIAQIVVLPKAGTLAESGKDECASKQRHAVEPRA